MSIIGALTGGDTADAISAGAAYQAEAARRAEEELRKRYELGRADIQPWLTSGRNALAEETSLMGLGGDTAEAMRALRESPGYQFRLDTGMRGLQSGIAARGGMGSGKSMNAATRYGQDYASGEYGNRLNQLIGVSNSGLGAATGLANMGTQQGNTLADLWTNTANTQAASGIAGAQSRQSGLTGLANLGFAGYGAYKYKG